MSEAIPQKNPTPPDSTQQSSTSSDIGFLSGRKVRNLGAAPQLSKQQATAKTIPYTQTETEEAITSTKVADTIARRQLKQMSLIERKIQAVDLQLVEMERQRQADAISQNYDKILSLKASDSIDQDTKEMIAQTYRQMLGKLIDADFGNAIKAKVLFQFNELRAHLTKEFPDLLPEASSQLKVISGLYRGAEIDTQDMNDKRQAQWQEVDRKIGDLRDHYIQKSSVGTGVNSADFVRLTDRDNSLVAVSKQGTDTYLGIFIADMENKPWLQESLAPFGGMHETLVSHLNTLLGNRLGIPLVAQELTEDSSSTTQAFVENKGTYYQLLPKDINEQQTFLNSLNLLSSQRFVFAQLITRNTDCHRNNILITESGDPIGIDFGRILLPNPAHPLSQLKAAFLRFPCLDKPINQEDAKFYRELDINKTISELKTAIKFEYDDLYGDQQLKPIIDKELNLLKARLIMIQEGVKLNATQRVLIALDLPPITDSDQAKIQLIGQLSGTPNSNQQATLAREILNEAGIFRNSGFTQSWEAAAGDHELNEERFRTEIRSHIQQLQSTQTLYGDRERRYYRMANYDVS